MPGPLACRIGPGGSFARGTEGVSCDSIILGGIWRHLQSTKQGFLPGRASEYPGSASDLMESLYIMFSSIPCMPGHKDCIPTKKYAEFQKKTKLDERYQDVLRPHHKDRMAAQRMKTGL